MTEDLKMTPEELGQLMAEAFHSQQQINELHIGAIYAIAMRLGIGHEELMREAALIINKIENGEDPWTDDEV